MKHLVHIMQCFEQAIRYAEHEVTPTSRDLAEWQIALDKLRAMRPVQALPQSMPLYAILSSNEGQGPATFQTKEGV